jgi:fucose permease
MRPHWTDLHDGWIVVILGVLVVMCALGIGRYAFGMLLPSMGDGLALSYRQMGVISTSNFVGYLVGAVLSGRLIVRLGARRLIAAGLATIAVSLMIHLDQLELLARPRALYCDRAVGLPTSP